MGAALFVALVVGWSRKDGSLVGDKWWETHYQLETCCGEKQ